MNNLNIKNVLEVAHRNILMKHLLRIPCLHVYSIVQALFVYITHLQILILLLIA